MNSLFQIFPTLLRSVAASSLFCLLLAGQVPKEDKKQENPFAEDTDAIAVGKSLFRCYCAGCHGEKGQGGFRGPDLIRRRLIRSSSDKQMHQVVKQGIQGTQMPPHVLPDDQVWRIIAFISHTRSQSRVRTLTGDQDSGRDIFFSKSFCSNCHMIQGKGGRLGPDLTRVGKIRSVEALVESIREPSARFRNLRLAARGKST